MGSQCRALPGQQLRWGGSEDHGVQWVAHHDSIQSAEAFLDEKEGTGHRSRTMGGLARPDIVGTSLTVLVLGRN